MEALRPAQSLLRLSAPRRVPRPALISFCQCLHTSSSRCATPLPHPSVPGPPPETPTPAASDALDRVARKRKQAELLKQAQEIRTTPSKPKTVLQKRFWKDVSVKQTPDGLQVYLDSRPVRTPTKQILTLPPSKHQLATAIALEWDLLVSAQQALKSHYTPMTSLAARALDIEKVDAENKPNVRDDIVRMLMRYLTTDTLLCWAPERNIHDAPQDGASLRQLQMKVAQPIIAYLATHVWPGVEIKPILEPDSILPISQPDMTKEVVRGWLSGLPAFELAGLERAVLASKSLLVGVRLIHEWGEAFAQSRAAAAERGRFGIEEAAEASSVEVTWQTGQWGEVEDTHDVEKEDLRRQLGSVVVLVGGDSS
ncbi:ATP12-domain-containing protein [Zopfia rhizophila CBS 207.26]|uniref:ATP12-domain-containing protein n=1 Tax=Zopfia rhizophila CBS 207.26 TaxID=1314779 RepID=A0A6A6DY91_9PEZI|nr:ATP12-domain-containing protein [Zopfia rhizophila CBS 207.26]